MTADQFAVLIDVLACHLPLGLRHGDCRGADAEACRTAQALSIPTHAHPGMSMLWRAHTTGNLTVAKPKPELARDRVIARLCLYLIAIPKDFTEQKRSGTWATIRYAHQYGKPIIYIYPDGCSELAMPDGTMHPPLTTPAGFPKIS